MGEGFWLNARTGEEVEVSEHLTAVLSNPEQFGLHLQDAPSRDPESRRKILTDVIRNGWIRVRTYRNQYTFECWQINDDVLFTILEFTDRHKFWDTESLDIHEVGRAGGGIHIKVRDLKAQLAPTIEALEARRRNQIVARIRLNCVLPAVRQVASESFERLSACGMVRLYEDRHDLVLEVRSQAEEHEAVYVLVNAEASLLESKLRSLPNVNAAISMVTVIEG